MSRPAVFIDRDGVLIEEVGYVGEVDRVQLIPGAAQAVRRINQLGWPVVVVTNQSGVARGFFTEDHVKEVHQHIVELLQKEDARINQFEYCPHHPDGAGEYQRDCDCRKPEPGMLRRAALDLDIDLGSSWMIGDRLSDLQAGAAVSASSILVQTGYGPNVEMIEPHPLKFVGIVPSIVEAIELILNKERA